jgi:hypothetical protein
MTSKDGFIITGGGFLVTGVGDVSGDAVADVMITSFSDWKGRSSAYLITTPTNMTYSPSLQPSSTPTITPTVVPTYSPSLNISNNSTRSPTRMPSFRPSTVPTLRNATRTPSRAVLAIGSARPSIGKLSCSPSLTPTSGYHRLRGFPTTRIPTMIPTINTTSFTEILCSEAKEYQGRNGTHNLFRITVNTGTVRIIGNDEGGAKNIYVLYSPSDRVNVVIQNFRIATDMISVVHLSQAGYSYRSLNDISYSKSDPLTFLFCAEHKLQVILSSHTKFDLQENNFLFPQWNGFDAKTQNKNSSTVARVQIGIVLGILLFILAIFLSLNYQKKQDEKKKTQFEEQWLNSLTITVEEHHLSTNCVGDPENQLLGDHPVSLIAPVVVKSSNVDHEMIENKQSSSSFSASGSSSTTFSSVKVESAPLSQAAAIDDIASINSDDWQNALDDSDGSEDNIDKHPDEQLPEQSVTCVALSNTDNSVVRLPDNQSSNASSSSSSSSSSSEKESRLPSDSMPFEEYRAEAGNSAKSNHDDNNTIDTDDWQDALGSSDDEGMM